MFCGNFNKAIILVCHGRGFCSATNCLLQVYYFFKKKKGTLNRIMAHCCEPHTYGILITFRFSNQMNAVLKHSWKWWSSIIRKWPHCKFIYFSQKMSVWLALVGVDFPHRSLGRHVSFGPLESDPFSNRSEAKKNWTPRVKYLECTEYSVSVPISSKWTSDHIYTRAPMGDTLIAIMTRINRIRAYRCISL